MTYRKKNGEIIQRVVNYYNGRKIGDVNAYGWKVINKEYSYNKRYYSKITYDRILEKEFKKEKKKIQIKNKIKKIWNEIIYLIVLIHLISLFKMLLK